MTTSTHGGARRGNKATHKRQQQQKLKSGSRKRRSHYKLLTQKQQLGGVIERGPHRKAMRQKAHESQSQRKTSTTQSPGSEAAQKDELIEVESIYGEHGKPPATPIYQMSPQPNASTARKVTPPPPRPTAPKPRMQPAAGEQPEYNLKKIINWEVPDSLKEKYGKIPMEDTKEKQTINSDKKPLNRYPNILPYVDNTLQVEGVNYINASPITLKVGDGPQLSYIATQCPTTASFPDFWKMIFQYKVPVICMVTNLVEGDKIKCNQYYQEGVHKQVKHDDITITLISEENISAAIIKREFNIKKDYQEHKVIHLHYTAWPDLDYPPIDADRAQLIILSNEISKACNGGTAPPVIHCSAGVGRTGSIIAINYLMHIPKEIRDKGLKNENDPNMLLQIIKQLRQQRLWMVQKPTQFVGIIQTVLNTNGVDNQLWTCDIKSTKPT